MPLLNRQSLQGTGALPSLKEDIQDNENNEINEEDTDKPRFICGRTQGQHAAFLLASAKSFREKVRTQWNPFDGAEPQLAKKRCFDVKADMWVEEQVMVQMDKVPFGKGACRECFRMKEIHLDPTVIKTPLAASGTPTWATPTANSGNERFRTPHKEEHRLQMGDIARSLLELKHVERRNVWVAKRSLEDFNRKFLHRQACETDVIQQTLAKHYAELFNRDVHRCAEESGMGRCGAHDIDFLLTHVIKLSDGHTYSAEAFTLGQYEKHNTNGGLTIGTRTTPQAFSYYSWVKSNHRLMVVDIQGVGDLYTDPVVHSLPSHFSGTLKETLGELNFGIRGFALFLWSHRRNDIDRLLNLPSFPLSPHESAQINFQTGMQVTTLQTIAKEMAKKGNPQGRAKVKSKDLKAEKNKKDDEATPKPPQFQVELGQVLGIRLADWCDWRMAFPRTRSRGSSLDGESGPSRRKARELEMVEAECHMEIAAMYNRGRITLRAGEPRGDPDRREVEAAVFHVVEAARQDLVDAMLALAAFIDGRGHSHFLPQVSPAPELRSTALALLANAATLGSSVAMGALARLILDETSGYLEGPTTEVELRAAAQHLEGFGSEVTRDMEDAIAKHEEKMERKRRKAFSDDEKNGEDDDDDDDDSDDEEAQDLDHEKNALHGQTFGWDNHGWTAENAYLKAAELWESGKLTEDNADDDDDDEQEGADARGQDLRCMAAHAAEVQEKFNALPKRKSSDSDSDSD